MENDWSDDIEKILENIRINCVIYSKEYKKLVTEVAQTVANQPIKYLQNVGGGTLPFLYERNKSSIILKIGVAYCLRRFQPLIQQLSRSRWTDYIKKNAKNIPILGEKDDLGSFLFETSRKKLEKSSTAV
jgi:hypothetical protein